MVVVILLFLSILCVGYLIGILHTSVSRINKEYWPLEAEGKKIIFINNDSSIFLLPLPFIGISHSHPHNANVAHAFWLIQVRLE